MGLITGSNQEIARSGQKLLSGRKEPTEIDKIYLIIVDKMTRNDSKLSD